MGQKITDGVLVSAFNSLDEFDVSVLVSTGPDVYVTKSTTFGTLKENILKSPDTLQSIHIENDGINILWDNVETGEMNFNDVSIRMGHSVKIQFDSPIIEMADGSILSSEDGNTYLSLLSGVGGKMYVYNGDFDFDLQGNDLNVVGGALRSKHQTHFGDMGSVDAELFFYNDTNSNYTRVLSGVNSATYDITLPLSQGASGQSFINDGSGVLSWGMAGSGTFLPLSGGTETGNILFVSGYGIDTTATGGSDVLNIGTTNANVINIGNAGAIVNILGSSIYEIAVNSYVEDKLMTLNYGGSVASGVGVGYEIEENAIITGYQKTNAARSGWSFKAPANTDYTDFVFTASVPRSKTFQDTTSTIAEYANKLSVFAATTSAELAGVISDETGYSSGAVLVFSKSPSIDAPTFTTSITGSYLTASRVAIVDGSKNVISADTATYPSLTEFAFVKGLTSQAVGASDVSNSKLDVKGIVIDGQGGIALTGGVGGTIVIPYNGTITGWTISSINRTTRAALAISAVVDMWKTTYTLSPATVANTIFSGNKPTLTAQSKNVNTSMSVAVTAGDRILVNLDSNDLGQLITVALNITKS